MDPSHKILDSEAKPKTFPFPNGALKKHHHHWPPPPPPAAPAPAAIYRECLKNHAASLGGHALDGCGEFMPSPASNPADPTSLTCAACGCHRNFHRRLPVAAAASDDGDDGDDEEEDGGDRHSSSPPPPSAPHMLLALSAGINSSAGPTPSTAAASPVGPAGVGVGVGPLPRKRFRTKFSSEQKERMHELSERLGWRMQKRDESMVEEHCREIGVGKGVFKVWMHNNKHNFVGSRRDGGGGGSSGGDRIDKNGGIEGNGGGGGEGEYSNVGNGGGGGGGGSTSSS